jgi:hypothetical protein
LSDGRGLAATVDIDGDVVVAAVVVVDDFDAVGDDVVDCTVAVSGVGLHAVTNITTRRNNIHNEFFILLLRHFKRMFYRVAYFIIAYFFIDGI